MNETVSPAAQTGRASATFGRSSSAPDFVRAHRHSRKVRFVKRVLPVLLGGTLIALVGVSVLQQMNIKIELPFELGALHLSGTRLTMEVPKLSGFTDDGRGYWVNAASASQDLTNPDILELTDIDARLELANKGWAGVKSKTGAVDTKRQVIWLKDGVDLSTAAGYSGRLADAEVDAKAGSVATGNPVVLTYKDGKLTADRMTVKDRGSYAFFEGHVQLDFRMSDMPDRQNPPVAPGAPPTSPAMVPAGGQQSGALQMTPQRGTVPVNTTVASKPGSAPTAATAPTGAKR